MKNTKAVVERSWMESVFSPENEINYLTGRKNYLSKHNKTGKHDVELKKIDNDLVKIYAKKLK